MSNYTIDQYAGIWGENWIVSLWHCLSAIFVPRIAPGQLWEMESRGKKYRAIVLSVSKNNVHYEWLTGGSKTSSFYAFRSIYSKLG